MIVVDTLFEAAVERFVAMRAGVDVARDPRDEDGEVPYLTKEGYMLVTCQPEVDGPAVARELERQLRSQARVVKAGPINLTRRAR